MKILHWAAILSMLAFVGSLMAAAPENLDSFLEPIRALNHFPALAAAVVRGNQTVAIGAIGMRKSGGTETVTLDDKFHIGSCTKSMTATLAAVMVEQGKIKWSTTIADVFPELKNVMHEDYRSVTLEQLLSHRGGVPADLNADGLWKRLWMRQGIPRQQRMNLLQGVVMKAPAAKPGTKYIYANGGVAIAGAMLEQTLNKDWETLITEMLFKPLGMNSVGFGAPGTAGKEDQPWGHVKKGETITPRPPGPMTDNPPAIAPAGTVHCSVGDLAKYVAFHAHHQSPLLKSESFSKLHSPEPGQEYGFGWIVVDRPWGGGQVLTHAGSNTMNYTIVWIAPNKDFGVIVETNIAGDGVGAACDRIVGELIQKYLLKN